VEGRVRVSRTERREERRGKGVEAQAVLAQGRAEQPEIPTGRLISAPHNTKFVGVTF